MKRSARGHARPHREAIGKSLAKAVPESPQKNPGGRPSKFRPEFIHQAVKLVALGAIDADLADFFGVAASTINLWKKVHPEFSESLKTAKDEVDARVQQALYKRATGYSHPAVKIFCDQKTGAQVIVEYTQHYPPDTTACIFWLKNRQPGAWREKVEHEHDSNPDDPMARLLRQIAESPNSRLQPTMVGY